MIHVNFKAYNSYTVSDIYQWDLNRELIVHGFSIATAPEFHFSNANMEYAIVRQAELSNGTATATIPNSILQFPLTIHVHIGIYEGDEFKVIERVDIPVKPRKRPYDYTLDASDDEVYSFNSVLNAVANRVKIDDYNSEMNVINSRLATIIAHNNDADGNTELLDVRTAADGTVYTSAGDAVRGQIKSVAYNNTVKCYVGVGEGKIPEIGYDYIIIPSSIIILYDKERNVLLPDDIIGQLPNNASLTEDGGCRINVNNECALIFDTAAKTLRVNYRPLVKNTEIVLFYNYYSNASGPLVDNYSYKRSSDVLSDTINKANSYEKTRNGYVQLSSNGRVKVEYQSDGTIVTIPTSFLVCKNNAREYIRSDDIITQLPKLATKNADESTSIFIANERALVLNLDTLTLSTVSITKIPQNCFLLYAAYWENDYGMLAEKYARDLILDNNQKFEETSTSMSSIFNSPPIKTTYDWETKCKEYAALFNNTNNVESFIFFTDPHLTQNTGWENQCIEYINVLNKIYNSTPTSYIVCGGDWLGNSDTQEYACFKLGYIDGFTRSMFDRFYHVVGNHDTNYQGKLNATAEKWTGTLDNNTIRNLWYRDIGRAYYRFDGVTSSNYVLDTQLDSTNAIMDAYKWSQIDWVAKDLIEHDAPNNVIYMHIVYIDDENNISAMATNVGSLISAYNSRTTVVLNGVTYDFSDCTGHIDYVLSGHVHRDYNAVLGGIPSIATIDMRSGSTPTFDLCLADYDKRKLHCVRVGSGENRTFDF